MSRWRRIWGKTFRLDPGTYCLSQLRRAVSRVDVRADGTRVGGGLYAHYDPEVRRLREPLGNLHKALGGPL